MGDFNHGNIQWDTLDSTGVEDQPCIYVPYTGQFPHSRKLKVVGLGCGKQPTIQRAAAGARP